MTKFGAYKLPLGIACITLQKVDILNSQRGSRSQTLGVEIGSVLKLGIDYRLL